MQTDDMLFLSFFQGEEGIGIQGIQGPRGEPGEKVNLTDGFC